MKGDVNFLGDWRIVCRGTTPIRFGVGMRVRETAGCRNNFKAWNERRGMVTVCFSLQYSAPLRRRSQECPGISGTQNVSSPIFCFVKPSCRDFSDKQQIQIQNHRTQRNPS